VTLRSYAKKTIPEKAFIGFGDPTFTENNKDMSSGVTQRGIPIAQRSLLNTRDISKLPDLPETSIELRKIARALKADESDLYLRDKATEKNVRANTLNEYSVIAFATHGLVAGDLDGLEQPALALTPPESPSREDDGLLEMSEVLGLKLNADWVILSACNTAASDGSLQSDGLTGLAQAFFYAGSRAMLVSLWPVESSSTQLLTTSIFNNQANLQRYQRAASLQVARKRLISGKGYEENGKELFSYAHPIFWAAFMMVGEGSMQ
jgi:CHAT domain-containing protein